MHGVKFPNGTTATDKIIKILTKEAHFLPSFCPLKPHIKDHKLQKSILEIIKEAEEKNTVPKIPLRLTHKATCGPTAGLAEIIGPILENLTSCCKLALTQASEDVAEFLAKVIFTEKPAFGAVDVNDAFWAMAKKTCLQRVRRLANRYPEILQSFGITPDGLIAAIELIWEDNFFVALGANGPIHGRINGCTMGNIISMALCRIYYFCSLEEAINKVGKEKFIYVKSGGDDALILAWKETDIEELITQLNLLPDNWTYELRKPENGSLPFFDTRLALRPSDKGQWIIDTGVYFKPTDLLNRTHATSFWSWDHQEALLRSHLHRVAKICTNIPDAIRGLKKLGKMLAKREHPLENIIYSFERLNPTFLAEQTPARKVISPQNAPEIVIFGDWEQIERSKGIHLPGTVPFLGEGRNDQAKRVTGNFLATIAKMIHTNETAIVSVNNTPFKSLGRTLPVAKIAPPNLLDNTLVYQIPTNKHQCGIGQVGQRPVAHRMNEHFWEKRGKRGPYASTKCRPFTEMKVLVKEPHQIMRMAWEAIHIYINADCITQASLDISPWSHILSEYRKKSKSIKGGADPPPRSKPQETEHKARPPTMYEELLQASTEQNDENPDWFPIVSGEGAPLSLWTTEYLFLSCSKDMMDTFRIHGETDAFLRNVSHQCTRYSHQSTSKSDLQRLPSRHTFTLHRAYR